MHSLVYQAKPRLTSLSLSLTGKETLTQFPLLGSSTNPAHWKAHLKQCDLLRLSQKQKRLCRREPGLAETLRDAIRLGILECQYQFRNERWNCSLDGRANLLKRGKQEHQFHQVLKPPEQQKPLNLASFSLGCPLPSVIIRS